MALKFVEDRIPEGDATISRGREVILIEADALKILAQSLDGNFVSACETILASTGRIIVTGIGKSGHIARKIAATFSSTGTPAVYLHPAEAAHGDLGMMTKDDTLVVISNSGNTSELRSVLSYAEQLGLPVIGIASSPNSLVMKYSTIRLCLPVAREACSANIAPTTSTTLQLAMGDALAMAIMDMRGISSNDLRSLHPGGSIGLRLTPVGDIMPSLDTLPMVKINASMSDTIAAMTSCALGITGVKDMDGLLIGVVTDGDLRRHFDQLSIVLAGDIMTRDPKTVSADMMAQDALRLLNDNKITAAFVLDSLGGSNPGRPIGIVHIHDFLRFGLN